AIINSFPLYLFVPLPLFWTLAIWQHTWQSTWYLIIPTAIFLYLFGGLFWPSFSTPSSEDRLNIKVMSYNIWLENQDFAAIIRSIRSADADIVGLQEVTTPAAKALITELEDVYPYHTLSSLKSESTVALLSRYPLENVTWYTFIPRHRTLKATVNIAEQRITLYNIHLTSSQFYSLYRPLSEAISKIITRTHTRNQEVEQVVDLISQQQGPIIFFSDCNFADTNTNYARIRAHLRDSFRDVGWGFGHTARPIQLPFPLQRVDFIWYTTDFQAVASYIGDRGSSDHLPIISEFAIISQTSTLNTTE
ncbi:MAG: endonuclease/exonuclease/phosphatase family protein, partial [Chloroflexota bacterium]